MEKPFGPALNAAIDLLQAQLNTRAIQIVQEEAKALDLPTGWSVDLSKRIWTIPSGPKAVMREAVTAALAKADKDGKK